MSDIEHARWRVQAGLEQLNQCAAELRRWAEVYEQRAQEEHAEVRQELSEYARSAGAPQELRQLQEQIDRGELSWYGALIGEADEVIDRRAREFLAGRLESLSVLGEALRSGASVQEAAELAASRAQERERPRERQGGAVR